MRPVRPALPHRRFASIDHRGDGARDPVVASAVGGIPELLPAQYLVQCGDPRAFADRIAVCLDKPERLAAMSAENLARARNFAASAIAPRRKAFYEAFLSQVRSEATSRRAAQR